MALKTYKSTYTASDGSTRFRISIYPPTNTTTTSSSSSSSSSSGNIKTGTAITGQKTYTTTDGRSFNDSKTASQEQAKINASSLTTTSKSLIDSSATDKLTIIDTKTGKTLQQGTRTTNYSPFPGGAPSGFEQIKKIQESGGRVGESLSDAQFISDLKQATKTDSQGRITTMSDSFSYDPKLTKMAFDIYKKSGGVPEELKQKLSGFTSGTLLAQRVSKTSANNFGGSLDTSNKVIKYDLFGEPTKKLTAKQAFEDSSRLAAITQKLQREGAFPKAEFEPRQTDVERTFERAQARVGAFEGSIDSYLRQQERDAGVFGQGIAFGGGFLVGATSAAQGVLSFGGFALGDIPRGLPKTTKFFGETSKSALDFVSKPIPTQLEITSAVLTGAFGETVKGFQERPGVSFGKLGFDLLLVKGATTAVSSGITRFAGLKSTIGKPFIAPSKIVVPEVLKGKTLFPLTKGFKVGGNPLKEFFKSPFAKLGKDRFVFSATPAPLKKNIVVQTGKGLVKSKDVPGLFFSTKGVSPYFTRVFGKTTATKYKLFPTSLKELKESFLPKFPKIVALKTTPQKIPRLFTTSYVKAQSFFGKEFSGGKAFLKSTFKEQARLRPTFTPATYFSKRVEAEAVLGVGKKLTREKVLGFTKFSTFGPRVPIIEYKVTGTATKVGQQIAKVIPGGSISSSVYSSQGFLISPSTLFAKSAISLFSSKSSFVSVPRNISFSRPFSQSTQGSSRAISSGFSTPSSFTSTPSSSGVVSKSGFTSTPSGFTSTPSGFTSTPSTMPKTPSTPSNIFSTPRSNLTRLSRITGGTSFNFSRPTPRPRQKQDDFSSETSQPFGTYHAYVRKDNNTKWVKVTSKAKPYNMAFNKGLMVADNTTAASVKLKRVGTKDLGYDDPFIASEKFTTRKGRTKVPGEERIFVEQNRFRIDTLGEKQGLSAKKYLKQVGMSPWAL